MPFPCPACGETIPGSPDRWALRCPACRKVLRARAVEASEAERLYDVEVAGHPETRRRITAPWTDDESRRLRAWLAWSTVLTLGLVVVLYALARWS